MTAAVALAVCLAFVTEDVSPAAPPNGRKDAPDEAAKAATKGGTLPSAEDAARGMERGLAYLLSTQNEDGSWGGTRNVTFTSSFANPATYQAWQVGTTGLVCRALLESGGEDAAAAARRGLDWLAAHGDLVRPAEWDVDNNWGLIYGLFALAGALKDGAHDDEAKEPWRAGALRMVEGLKRYQSPRGGWGYYADPEANWRPDWATSFTTAAGVLALLEAKEAGLEVDAKVLAAAVRAVERARLPNGAYDYDVSAVPRHFHLESINQVKGSLGRIQVGNVAVLRAGGTLPEGAIEDGLELFFRHHAFLEVARNKPIPHEAYYANAAYFYLFGHYYAACALDETKDARRDDWAARLRLEVLKCQQADGSIWDFWIAHNTKAYGTAFGVMALSKTIDARG